MELGLIFSTAANAVLPILLLILLGYGLRRSGMLTDDFSKLGSKLVFNVFLPVMLFNNVYEIEGFSSINWTMVWYVIAIICLLFVLGYVSALFATKVPERRGVIMQCAYRSNFAIIGIPLASALGGTEAIAMTAVVSAFSIPLYSIFSVVSLTMFMRDSSGKRQSAKSVLLSIITNPLIIAVLLGFVVLGIRTIQKEVLGQAVFTISGSLPFVYTALKNIASIASPFALVVMGAQFTFSAVKGLFKEIAVGTLCRIVIAPILGIGIAVLLTTYTDWFSCGVNEFPALIALFGSPMAISGAVMAAQMGNDEQLSTQLVVWPSVFSILTIFLTVCLLLPAGFLAA